VKGRRGALRRALAVAGALAASLGQRFVGGVLEAGIDGARSGECLLGLTDTDDVEVSRRAGDRISETLLPEEGTLILPNTVALVAGAPHPREARLLIDHLLAPEREELLAASSSRQIPLRPGVPVPPGGLSLAEVRSAPVSLEDAAAALPDALRIAREILGL